MAQRDPGMRMLINDEEDEEDDEDEDEDEDDVDAADDGDDGDDDDEDEDEDDEDEDEEDEDDEDEDENEDDDPLPAWNLLSRGGSNLGLPESFRVSNSPAPCLFLAKARATSASTSSFRHFSSFF